MTKKKNSSPTDLKTCFEEKKATLKKEKQRCFDLLQNYLEQKKESAFTLKMLQKAFSLPKHLKELLTFFVDTLTRDGDLKKEGESYSLATETTQSAQKVSRTSQDFVGKISLHPAGFGFVTLPAYDVFIPKHQVLHAMDQDIVEVEIISLEGRNKKGPEGRVVAIVQRNRTAILGTVVEIKPVHITVRAALQGESQLMSVPMPADPVAIGDRLLLEVHTLRNQLHLTYQSKLGSIFDPHCDLDAIRAEYSLPTSFPKACIEEAESYPSDIDVKQHPDRVDHTELFTATIDPKTAKDFDDALSIERTKNGYRLYVHVADASYYVKKGGALDEEALVRKNSTYLLGTCIPMLPPVLADNLCSLKQGVPRLAVTVEMELDKKGNLTSHKIYRSIINSDHRLSYEQAFEILQEKESSFLQEKLLIMQELALHFKALKFSRGSVDLSLSEMVWHLGKDGVPDGFHISHYDITHQLVEEFMLKANEVIATEIKKRDVALIYRIHEPPSPETMKEFIAFCKRLGIIFPEEYAPQDISKMFTEHRDSAFIQELSTRYIRSMRLATYSTDGIGHHGLMLENYTHFTSPIRRYVDIVIHRLLFRTEYTQDELNLIAQHSSEKERHSARAEMTFLFLKKLRYMERKYENDPERVYTAAITRVKPFGVAFEIKEFGLDGFLHISALGDDYFEFSPKKETIQGKRSLKRFELGIQFPVQIESVNLLFQEISWKMAPAT